VLAVYDVKPQVDDNGCEVEIKVDVTGELLSYVFNDILHPQKCFYSRYFCLSGRHPLPFQFRIIPRSKAAADLVNSSELLE
jgi:hypothetical protein